MAIHERAPNRESRRCIVSTLLGRIQPRPDRTHMALMVRFGELSRRSLAGAEFCRFPCGPVDGFDRPNLQPDNCLPSSADTSADVVDRVLGPCGWVLL